MCARVCVRVGGWVWVRVHACVRVRVCVCVCVCVHVHAHAHQNGKLRGVTGGAGPDYQGNDGHTRFNTA